MENVIHLPNRCTSSGFLIFINVKKFTMSIEYDITQKVLRLLLKETKEEIHKKIGISRPTLDARLKFNNWKKSEITLIKTL